MIDPALKPVTDDTPTPLPEIAPVEIMLAVIGLKPIVSREVETISPETLGKMDELPTEIAKLAKRLVHSDAKIAPEYDSFDAQLAINDLAAGWDVQQVVDMIHKFPVRYQAIGTALVVKSQEVIKQLMEGYPIAQYQTLSGSVNLKPTDFKKFKFKSILEIIDEPLRVFEFMSTGALLKSQAHAVRTVYPTLSACIDAAIMNETIAAKAADASFELPPRAEYGVKNWFQKSQVSASLLGQAQKNQVVANQRKAAARQPPPAPNEAKAAQSLLTSSQRAEAKAPAPT
jgi:hypothetical protein